MNHTSQELIAFKEEIAAIEKCIQARRDWFNEAGPHTCNDEGMIDAAFGNVLHTLNQIRNHAENLRGRAALGEAVGKTVSRAHDDASMIGAGLSPRLAAE